MLVFVHASFDVCACLCHCSSLECTYLHDKISDIALVWCMCLIVMEFGTLS